MVVVLHVVENDLRVVHSAVTKIVELLFAFLFEKVDQFGIKFALKTIDRNRFIKGVPKNQRSVLDELVLFPNLFLQLLHIAFDVVNIFNSLLCLRA